MPLSYQDVLTADLSSLSDVSKAWKTMGERFGELKGDYTAHVPRALDNGNWQGQAFGAHQNTSRATAYEYEAAKKEALAVAQILREGHTELTRLQKEVKDLVADAEEKDYKVDDAGKAKYVGFDKLSEDEKQAARHDPGYAEATAEAERQWTSKIAKAVRAVDDADQSVKRALSRAVADVSLDGSGFGGFNANAEGDLAKAGVPDSKTATQTDGWKREGDAKANGPDVGASATGPAYGKQGMLKAYADLGHATAQGSMTNGTVKLSGIGDAYAGARATASGGITDEGINGNAEVSAGGRAMAEGRAGTDMGSVYGRGSAFAGGEAGADVGLGPDGFSAGGKAFAGAKVSGAAGAEVGGIGAGVTGEAWAGPGVEADLTFGEKNDDGKFHIGAEVGASPILGGKVGMEFTIDPGKVADTAGDAADAVGDVAGGIGDAAGSAKDAVTSLF